MDWITAMQTFISVVDANSFNKAAEKLLTSPAGVSRQVSWLETQLNVTLLFRTTRVLHLTEEGKLFYQKSKQFIANLNEITQSFEKNQKTLSGPLKITLPISFGGLELIIQLINEFSKTYPDIEINLYFSNRVQDLIQEEIDIAFRSKPYEGNNYFSVKILTLQLGIFAAPSYLTKKGVPKSIHELTNHNCLSHHHIGNLEWEFKDQEKISITGNIQSNAGQPLIELAKLGHGIIRTFKIYIQQELKTNILQPILKKSWPDAVDIYLLVRSDLNTPLRVKTFADFAYQKLNKKNPESQ